MTDDLRAQVRNLLEVHVEVPDDDNAELWMSSLVVVQLVESLEEQLGVTFRADEIESARWKSVSTIVVLLRDKLAAS